MKHTPGPWSSQDREKQVFVPLKSVDCERIGFYVGFVNGHLQQEAAANARLIAAAPDLLEALKALEVLFSPCVRDSTQADWIDRARAAIKKAEEA
jgi:hypothetical protein